VLVNKAKTRSFHDVVDETRCLYEYMNMQEGQEEVFAVMDLIKNVDYKPVQADIKVAHCSQIGTMMHEKASGLRQANGMQMINTPYAKKEDRLEEAARLYLRAGNFRDYCETLFELGQYSKAIAFAPAVGIEYWQELTERHAILLEKQGNLDEAALACIVANKCDIAIEIFT
jgi:hypothetical protein